VELGEIGKLLGPATGRVDGKPPGGKSVHGVTGERPEVTRAEKRDEFVVVVGPVQRVVQPEPGNSRQVEAYEPVRLQGGAVFEVRRREMQFVRGSVLDREQ